MALSLLPFQADNIDVVVVVVMGWHCKHALMAVVLVAEVLLLQLPILVAALRDTRLGVAARIALCWPAGSFLACQVVP